MVARKLAEKYNKCPNAIRYLLHSYTLPTIAQSPRSLVLIMDVTYFTRSNGELIVIDPNYNKDKQEHQLIYAKHIDHTETINDYRLALDTILSAGYSIEEVVIDGRRDIRQLIESYDIPFNTVSFISY